MKRARAYALLGLVVLAVCWLLSVGLAVPLDRALAVVAAISLLADLLVSRLTLQVHVTHRCQVDAEDDPDDPDEDEIDEEPEPPRAEPQTDRMQLN